MEPSTVIPLVWALGAIGSIIAVFVTVILVLMNHMDKRFDQLSDQREADLQEIKAHKIQTEKSLSAYQLESMEKFVKSKELEEVKSNVDKIFRVLTSLARDVNRMAGKMGAIHSED